MLIEYYFKIQYTKGIKNIKVDILSKKAKLLRVMLRQDKDGLIRYNYPKLTAIEELGKVYKILESIQV